MVRNKGLWLLAIYLFLAIYMLPMFPHGGSDNEISRWATAASLVEKGSFEISWTEPLIGRNVDTAVVEGRHYSNKAPGVALLAVPLYAITRVAVGPPNASNMRVTWFAMRFFLSSLPLLLLGLWLYAKEVSEFSLAALLFATPLFVYSLLFFSHVLVGILIYFAFRLLYDQRVIQPSSCLAAGMLCGFAVICEFPAVFPLAAIGGGILFTEKRDRLARFSSFVLGGVPFAIFLLLYNGALFGSPLSMSYGSESFPEWAEVAGHGVFGIGFPTLSNAYLILFSPARGLLFTAPILIFTIICFFTSLDRSTLRHRVKIAAIVITIIFICGHGAAHGGWAFGPRYLILIIPLMLDSLFDHETYEFSNFWKGFLITISFILGVLPSLTFPFAPPEFGAPQTDFWLPLLFSEHWYVPTMANALGVSSSAWVLLPALIAFAFAMTIVALSMRRLDRFAIGLVAGCAVCAMIVFWPGLDSREDQFRRATIAERYFKPENRLEPFRAEARANNDWSLLKRVNDAEWNIATARSAGPDDFPYLANRELQPSPTALLRSAVDLQSKGDLEGAEKILTETIRRYDFARCEAMANLAVIHYTSDEKELALEELEAVQPLVNPGSTPECVRTQFLLGSLYQEKARAGDANRAFQAFLANSQGSNDPQILSLRQQLKK